MSGRTDTYIARRAIEQIKGSCTKSDVETFIEAYAKRLPETLAERHGHLLPFVKETLAYTQAAPDVTNLLLTGNCEKAALAKLAILGLITILTAVSVPLEKSVSFAMIFQGPCGKN